MSGCSRRCLRWGEAGGPTAWSVPGQVACGQGSWERPLEPSPCPASHTRTDLGVRDKEEPGVALREGGHQGGQCWALSVWGSAHKWGGHSPPSSTEIWGSLPWDGPGGCELSLLLMPRASPRLGCAVASFLGRKVLIETPAPQASQWLAGGIGRD